MELGLFEAGVIEGHTEEGELDRGMDWEVWVFYEALWF